MQKYYALHSLYSFQARYQERKRLAEELGMTTEEMKTWQDSLGFANSSSPPDDSFFVDEEDYSRFLQPGFYKPTANDDDDSSSSILSMPSDWVGAGVSCSFDDESDDDASAF
jgi:hypothetical protein